MDKLIITLATLLTLLPLISCQAEQDKELEDTVTTEKEAEPKEYLKLLDETETDGVYVVGDVEIKRVMTSCAKNKGWIQPLIPAEGVTPVTEREILPALNDKNAIVIDMRSLEWYIQATIPGSVHIPYTEVATRMDELGCTKLESGWDCQAAKDVYGFCNGPVCAQSPIAMRAMIRDGFPASKIYYYRGGMLDWEALGLTTVEGEM